MNWAVDELNKVHAVMSPLSDPSKNLYLGWLFKAFVTETSKSLYSKSSSALTMLF